MSGESSNLRELLAWDVEDEFNKRFSSENPVISGLYISLTGGIWVYHGVASDYVILRKLYCSCKGFQFSLSRGLPLCKHLLGLEAAIARGSYKKLELEPRKVAKIVSECLEAGLSITLRRLLAHG